ncbi:MAG: hypothetical protein ACHP84_11270 [Caulobacterales bacterium]
MFEFGRELRRLFSHPLSAPKDGLTGGDAGLLELLDLAMLRAEGKAADVAAGRISVKDRARRLLEAAVVWRETARRGGDALILRKAASCAEAAAEAFGRARRPQGWARARVEQGLCAMLGAELFGHDGLEAAAERTADEARRTGGAAGMLAMTMIAEVRARRVVAKGDLVAVRMAARAFNDPIAMLEAAGRKSGALKLAAATARLARAEILSGAGMRLKDDGLLRAALGDLEAAGEKLDSAYEPLTVSRIELARGAVRASLAELVGDVAGLAKAVGDIAGALENVAREHSPLDWARGQAILAQALQSLGEATAGEAAFEKAATCYDRAGLVLKDAPGLSLRAVVASNRALCLARSAELTGDLSVLDAAETGFKSELAQSPHQKDPAAWALLQVQLGQIYVTRLRLTGKDRGERAAAALAFSAALDVFGELGLRSLSAVASDSLEQLAAVPAH